MTNRVWARQRLKLQRLGLADHMTARPGRRPWGVLKAKAGRKLVRYWVDELDRRLLAHMSLDHGSKVDNPPRRPIPASTGDPLKCPRSTTDSSTPR